MNIELGEEQRAFIANYIFSQISPDAIRAITESEFDKIIKPQDWSNKTVLTDVVKDSILSIIRSGVVAILGDQSIIDQINQSVKNVLVAILNKINKSEWIEKISDDIVSDISSDTINSIESNVIDVSRKTSVQVIGEDESGFDLEEEDEEKDKNSGW